jgi:hypothetical protein
MKCEIYVCMYVYIRFVYFYNFTNCRFHILQHQLGNLLGNFNYIAQKQIHFKLRIQRKHNTHIIVILHVYTWRWSAKTKTCSVLIW